MDIGGCEVGESGGVMILLVVVVVLERRQAALAFFGSRGLCER